MPTLIRWADTGALSLGGLVSLRIEAEFWERNEYGQFKEMESGQNNVDDLFI